jgi:hypothetical protein
MSQATAGWPTWTATACCSFQIRSLLRVRAAGGFESLPAGWLIWTATACCSFRIRSLLRVRATGGFESLPAGWLFKAAAGCRSPCPHHFRLPSATLVAGLTATGYRDRFFSSRISSARLRITARQNSTRLDESTARLARSARSNSSAVAKSTFQGGASACPSRCRASSRTIARSISPISSFVLFPLGPKYCRIVLVLRFNCFASQGRSLPMAANLLEISR